MGARSWSDRWSRSNAQSVHQGHHQHLDHNPSTVLYVPPGAQDRLAHDAALFHDRQVRLQSVHNDMELDLPPTISLPDGEEYPYDSFKHLHLRNPEQESEIYRECIRPPPNRTIFEGESPPPYRSISVGTLHHTNGAPPRTKPDFSGSPLVMRCHSMSSNNSSSGGSIGSSGGSGRNTPLSHLRIARLVTRTTSSSATTASTLADGGNSDSSSNNSELSPPPFPSEDCGHTAPRSDIYGSRRVEGKGGGATV